MNVLSYEEIIKNEEGQWKPYMRHWVSSLGKVKNCFGKIKLLSSEGKYSLAKNTQIYVGPLLAKVFQIEDYDKLEDTKYCVTKIDSSKEITVENIKVVSKAQISELNGKLSRQSEAFRDNMQLTPEEFCDIDCKVVSELLPHHTIYRNGEIWNGKRWLVFSKSGGYLQLCTKHSIYKVHRLICYAFNKIDGKNLWDDYKILQVNHKDGNKENNHADNLEWCLQTVNMNHAYDTGLNKKIRSVIQYSLDKSAMLGEYPSLAKASKLTGEPEHRIRDICNDRANSKAQFYWKWKNKEESYEYSQKFRSRPT
jgi:hypothetical protein